MLKKNVLRKKDDFDLLYKNGKSIGDRFIVLFFRKNGLTFNRTGFLASKKVGNSVKRNRARRLMRESYKNIVTRLPEGYDFILIARNTINGQKCQEVEESMASSFKRAGLLEKKDEDNK